MSSLQQLQKQLQQFLLTAEKGIQTAVSGPDQAFVTERLHIYASAYELRLLGVLKSYFPAFAALADEPLCSELGLQYIKAYPSKYPNARYFGQHLVEFLSAHKVAPQLVQMAKFEWALSLAEDAPDLKLLQTADLANIAEQDWPELRLYLHPSVQFVELDYNIPELWQAIQGQQPLPALIATGRQTWTIWRHELVPYYHVPSDLERWFLAAVVQGKTFGVICEELGQQMPEEQAAQQVVQLVLTCIHNHMLSYSKAQQ